MMMFRFQMPSERIACLTLLLTLSLPGRAAGADKQLDEKVQQAIRKAAPWTVRIRIVGSSDNSGQAVTSQTTTGVVVSDSGLIISSVFGFVNKPTAIFVNDSQGERVAAKLLATDYVRKLVLLQTNGGRFQAARFSKKEWPAVGEYAIAAGRLYPGEFPSVSLGIISANRRIHGLAIQTDAKVSPVNYGGPILDVDGLVTGILVPLSPRETGQGINAGVEWYDSGIGFAIPASDLPGVVRELKTGVDRKRGFLGIRPATENPLSSDVRITTVLPNSPAEDSGLQTNDRVVAVNNTPVTRYGEFQSIIKRAYANDRVSLKLKRGNKDIDVDVILVDRLVPPNRGYIGLIPGEVEKDDQQSGVWASLLPGSPLAVETGLSRFIVRKWGSKDVTSRTRLKRLLEEAVVDEPVEISFSVSLADESKTLSVTPQEPPEELPELTADFVQEVLDVDTETEWQDFDESLGDDSGKVWGYGPKDRKTAATGAILLLAESTSRREQVTNRWKKLCRQHNLMIVVPVNEEGTMLTREDKDLVVAAFQKASFGRRLDPDRICIVADQAVAELGTEILLSPEARTFNAAAYIETWPRTTGIPAQAVAEKPPKLLILNGIVDSRTARALRSEALNRVSEGGGSVIQSQTGGARSIEELIANWCLTLKAR